jgi:hypothetical protein
MMVNLEYVGSFTWDCEREVEKGSGNGEFVSLWAVRREPGGGFFSGNFEYR